MRKSVFVIFVAVALLCLVSCGKQEESHVVTQEIYPDAEDLHVDINEIYPEEFVVEDTSALDEVLKHEYDINELKEFFKNRCRHSIFENSGGTMYFDEVNERYPIEVIRPQGYSVYKVSQGGYYYVFWIKSVGLEEGERIYRPVVDFTAHLSSELESEAFEPLKIGKSTANDVREIDPEVEFNFALSSGIYSYSFLNQDELMQIEYKFSNKGHDDYNDMIVESMTVIPRNKRSSQFTSILQKDLP